MQEVIASDRQQVQAAKRAVLQYLRSWPESRLVEAMAFNQDGQMDYYDPCCCLRGVALAQYLHRSESIVGRIPFQDCPEGADHRLLSGQTCHVPTHYFLANTLEAQRAELAYYELGRRDERFGVCSEKLRQQRMDTLFRIALRQRAQARRKTAPALQEVCC